MVGRVIGNYEIVERIGEGGMGTVWRAVDVMLEREVAIKAVRSDLAAEPQIVERFRSEAKILARVHHPAIATIYSFFREGGELYLAMEFVRGRSLAKVLQEEGALPWPRAVTLTAAALEGIEQVHRTGIVHRDLKPDNLMLTESGDIKVMDFGIARVAGENRLTRTGFMVGTVRYMAPEQLRGEEVDSRADLYALGVVLYEMLTGRVPFEAASEYEAIRAQVEDPPVPPSQRVPSLPAWLDRVVLTALAKRPEERYPSAAAMAEALSAARYQPQTAELPTVVHRPYPLPPPAPPAPGAGPAGSSYRAIGMGRSRGLLLGVAGAVLFFAVAAGVAWFLRGRSAPAPAAESAAATTPAPAPAQRVSAARPPSPAPAAAPSEAKPVPLPTVNPAFPEPKPPVRRSPPPSTPPQETAAKEPLAPSPAAPAQEEPAAATAEAPNLAEDLPHLGDQLDAAGGRLADAVSDFRSQKKDRGETLTEADDKLRDEVDTLRAATTRFNRRVNASFFRRATWRLRREGEERQRAELAERVREIDDTAQRIESLAAQLRPGEGFLAVWREVRAIRKRIDTVSGR